MAIAANVRSDFKKCIKNIRGDSKGFQLPSLWRKKPHEINVHKEKKIHEGGNATIWEVFPQRFSPFLWAFNIWW